MFSVRTSAPATWSQLYNNTSNGGLSWCINGRPTHPRNNVIANCVGYACSRFNEIYNLETNSSGMKYRELCCNAEDFWTRADSLGLKKGATPKPGAIMCWEGIGDLAGHVAIIERVNNVNQVYTSESGYDSAYFWNAVRYKGNGNWGASDKYRFRGFIYNPGVVEYTWKEKWHLYDSDGNMQTGWKRVNGKWYYMDSHGIMQTGWIKLGSNWFYLESSGAMLTGWQKINNKWYYFDDKGYMKVGWLKDNEKWYFLSNNGDMLTGWQKINGKWYYLDPSKGEMKTGWLKVNNKWYYLDPKNGDMKVGWLKDNEKWYYLSANGSMVTGTVTIDGKTYKFDSSGALIS